MATEIMPANINLTMRNGMAIWQGATWSAEFRLFNRENLVDTPIDLTGYTGRCSIKRYTGESEAIATPTVTITDATNGKFTLSLTASQTSQFITKGRDFRDVTTLVYDVYFDKNSASYRALMGNVEVSPAVTESDDSDDEEDEE